MKTPASFRACKWLGSPSDRSGRLSRVCVLSISLFVIVVAVVFVVVVVVVVDVIRQFPIPRSRPARRFERARSPAAAIATHATKPHRNFLTITQTDVLPCPADCFVTAADRVGCVIVQQLTESRPEPCSRVNLGRGALRQNRQPSSRPSADNVPILLLASGLAVRIEGAAVLRGLCRTRGLWRCRTGAE